MEQVYAVGFTVHFLFINNLNNMTQAELKKECDLISLVANAVATNTIEEAIQYLIERFDIEQETVYHCYCVLNKILEKKK